MLYSGDAGAAGLLAQVFVHAAAASNEQKKRLAQQQALADKVLLPLSELIDSSSLKDLAFRSPSFKILDVGDLESPDGVVLRSKPIFFLSQDGSTLSLKNIVTVSDKNESTKRPLLYSNLIEVVHVREGQSYLEFLSTADLGVFNVVAANLLEISLEAAIQDIQGSYVQQKKQKTFKIRRNKEKLSYERGYLLAKDCKKRHVRNLRKWVIVELLADESCASAKTSAAPVT